MREALDEPANDRKGPAIHTTATYGAADYLGLAAAPTFAIMALLTGAIGGGQVAMICGAVQEPEILGGMVPMYMLMSVFHTVPWLKIISNQRATARASRNRARADGR